MSPQLRPVSDLQRVQRFDDYDLAANRTGALSPRQRGQMVRRWLAEHGLGSLIALLGFALLIDTLQVAPSLEVILVMLVVIVAAMAVLLVIRARSVRTAQVKS